MKRPVQKHTDETTNKSYLWDIPIVKNNELLPRPPDDKQNLDDCGFLIE